MWSRLGREMPAELPSSGLRRAVALLTESAVVPAPCTEDCCRGAESGRGSENLTSPQATISQKLDVTGAITAGNLTTGNTTSIGALTAGVYRHWALSNA